MEIKINIDLIKQFMKENNLSKRRFAKQCGVLDCAIARLLNGKTNMRVYTIYKVAKGMDLFLKDMFEEIDKN